MKGRILAIDYGDKRVGLAVSDEMRIIATPMETIEGKTRKELIEIIASAVKERGVTLIVLGLPLNMDGSEGNRARKTREFAGLLEERLELPVEFIDERLTSVQADALISERGISRRDRKKRGLTDKVAAIIILRSFLDKG
ncbi:MAG: Holliday junction resolvase RuvX [Planctomycetes bacterium]|nr:Holliday junction resolvase RuvX [Planctomycetota bacterium]